METVVYLDTHVVLWLYGGKLSFPSQTALLINSKPLVISPMVLLEIQYLFEIGQIKKIDHVIFRSLEKSVGLKICPLEFSRVIEESLKQSWTRDPFDRLIAAHAILTKQVLITKDETMLKHVSRAIWK